jgi:hypothetical protein
VSEHKDQLQGDGRAGTVRPLAAEQRALLDFLLTESFHGRDELAAQARQVQTTGSSCGCGCPSFYLDPDRTLPPAQVDGPVAVDAHGQARDGSPVEILLFVRDGYLFDLEVVWFGAKPPAELPRPQDLAISRWSEPDERGVRRLLNP